MMVINIKEFSNNFVVQKLSDKDVDKVYELQCGNMEFYKCLHKVLEKESILRNIKAASSASENKYYIGFWRNNDLAAIMDLTLNYPKQDDAFIDFFMMNKKYQGMSIGGVIINELIKALKKYNFNTLKAGYIKEIADNSCFWLKNKFLLSDDEIILGKYKMGCMSRNIRAMN